jgi:hypothetical protein
VYQHRHATFARTTPPRYNRTKVLSTKERTMASIVDYVRSCTASFQDQPLGRLDGLVFSWLANLHIAEEVPESRTASGLSLEELIRDVSLMGTHAKATDLTDTSNLLTACAASPRYANVTVCHAESDWSQAAEKQFAAVTFAVPGGAFLAFRGTDDTLVGWKENFNLAYRRVVPAQSAARDYVIRIADELKRPLWLGGHSKGGNLAVYATAACDDFTRLRIQRCYSFDGPGLSPQAMAGLRWADAVPLVERFLPEQSFVGLLWNTADVPPTIVQSSREGIFQHSPLSWLVRGNDFLTADALRYDAYLMGKRFNLWLAATDLATRERFIELLYRLVTATGAKTASQLVELMKRETPQHLVARVEQLSSSDQAFFVRQLDNLAAMMLLGPAPANPQTPEEHAAVAMDKIDDLSVRIGSATSRLNKLYGMDL